MLGKKEKINSIICRIENIGYKVITVDDESHKHAGHQGFSDSGSHFHAKIEVHFSKSIEKISIQKKIMAQFLDLIPTHIHALRLSFEQPSSKRSTSGQ